MRLMLTAFAVVFLIVLDQSTFKGYYLDQVGRFVRYYFSQLGI